MTTTKTALVRTITRALTAAVLTGAALLGTTTATTATASAAPADCTYNPGGRGGYGTYLDKIAVDHRDWEIDVANGINAYRRQNNLPALTVSRNLARSAMWASLDSYNRGTSPANHVDTRGMGIAARATFCSGYTGYISEINYMGRGDHSWTGPQAAIKWWKSSPTHNRLMLDPKAKTFGVGLAYEGDDRHRAHYTVVFGDH